MPTNKNKGKISVEIRALMEAGGPPFDTAKVMAWFNKNAPSMFIEIDILEDDYEKHHPDETVLPRATEKFRKDTDELQKLVLPFFKKYLEETGCIRCANNRLLYLIEDAVYGYSLDNQSYCEKHEPHANER